MTNQEFENRLETIAKKLMGASYPFHVASDVADLLKMIEVLRETIRQYLRARDIDALIRLEQFCQEPDEIRFPNGSTVNLLPGGTKPRLRSVLPPPDEI